jgi:murein DD-endopeptidase MepM/ murein hydrolase activator NlpD
VVTLVLGRSHAFVLGVLVAFSISAGGQGPILAEEEDPADLADRVAVLEERYNVADGEAVPASLLRRIARLERVFRAQAVGEMRTTPRGSPVEGGIVTSGASPARFHPILHRYRPHNGVDIGTAAGTPIRATADGVVASRFDSPTYGLGLDLDHGRGTFTRYAHMSATAVRSGQRVSRGDVIGYVGESGRATGPHVHYEVFRGWRRVDPAVFLPDDLPVAAAAVHNGEF